LIFSDGFSFQPLIITQLGGLGLTGFGIYFRVGASIAQINHVLIEVGISISALHGLSYGIIAVGVICLFAGFSGCCGAIKESQCLLGTYITILVIILGGQIALVVTGITMAPEMENVIKSELGKVQLQSSNPNGKTELSVIALEETFQCCGLVNSCSDWTGGNTLGCGCQDTKAILAGKCGPVLTSTCSAEAGVTSIYKENCYTSIVDFIKSNAMVAVYIAASIAATEVLGICFACIMCCNLKDGYEAA